MDKLRVDQLKIRLRERGASTRGRKADLIERLEAYERNDNFGAEPVFLPAVIIPDWPDTGYKQLCLDHKHDIPHVHESHVQHYFVHRQAMDCFSSGDLKSLEKGKDLLDANKIEACSYRFCNDFYYFTGIVRAAMKKKITYSYKVKFGPSGEIVNTHCECPAGKGPHGTCSPVKGEALDVPSKHHTSLADPRPVHLQKREGYTDFVRNMVTNYCASKGKDIALRYTYSKADMQTAGIDHDYLQRPFMEYWVDEANKVTAAEITDIEIVTRNQRYSSRWHRERQWRLTASNCDVEQKETTQKKKSRKSGDKDIGPDQELGGDDLDEGQTDDLDEDVESDDDISNLMKGLRGGPEGYNSDDSEEERVLKQLLEKAQQSAAQDGEMGSDSDEDMQQDNSDLETLDEDQKDKFLRGSKATETPFQFGKPSSSKIKPGMGFNAKNKQPIKPQRTSVLDDQFFSLADMETFLNQEDLKEEREVARQRGEVGDEGDSGSDDSDVEPGDYGILYENLPSSDEDGTSDEGGLKYSDFFDAPPGGEMQTHGNTSQDGGDGVVDGDSSDNSSDEEQEDTEVGKGRDLLKDSESEGEEVKDILGGAPSTYEKRKQKLRQRITDMEEAALEEKPWQLKGEIAAGDRPMNSLLEETLDYDQQTRTAPVITEEVTKSLEEIIKQRIKDKAFDDVERKDKPAEQIFEYRKRVALDQEKSKLSLGEVYEREYLRQQEDEETEKTDPQKEKIKKMMTALFLKLDALSNFHFTPKPAAPEIRIVSNLPSVNMEEVMPVAVSDKTMLAPEEIKDKNKRETKGDTEKDKTDKQRERKDKKRRQRKKDKESRQKLLEKIAPTLGNKYNKEKAMKDLDRQSKSGKQVSVIQEKKRSKQKNLTSSTQFFTELQEKAATHIESHKVKKTKNKKKKGQSAAKLKL